MSTNESKRSNDTIEFEEMEHMEKLYEEYIEAIDEQVMGEGFNADFEEPQEDDEEEFPEPYNRSDLIAYMDPDDEWVDNDPSDDAMEAIEEIEREVTELDSTYSNLMWRKLEDGELDEIILRYAHRLWDDKGTAYTKSYHK